MNTTIPALPRLFVRLNASNYPNRQDFLVRLATANMLTGVNELPLILRMPYYKLIRMGAEELNGLMRGEPPMTNYQRGTLREMDTIVRICPECIAEDLPASATMNAHLPLPCERHNLMPIDECEGCKTTLSYKRFRIEYCDCGFALTNSKRILAPDWLPEFFRKYSFGGKQVTNGFDESDRSGCRLTANVIRVLLSNSESTHLYSWISLKEFLTFERFVTDWPRTLKKYIHSLSPEENNTRTRAVMSRICMVKNSTLAKASHSIWDEVRTDLDGARRLLFEQKENVETVSLKEASLMLGTDTNFTMHLWWSRWFHAAELEDDLWTPRFDKKHLTQVLEELRKRCLPGHYTELSFSQLWGDFRKNTIRPCAHLRKMAMYPAEWPLYANVVNPKINDMSPRVARWVNVDPVISIADKLFKAAVT